MTLNGVTWEVDDEMAEALVEGIDLIREVDGPMFVEKRLDLGRWMPGQFGTLDCGIAGKDVILISDLKYGRGVAVSAVKNTQQMIYALGFWDNIARHVTDAQRFRIVIDQPRNAAGGGEWEVSLGDLLAFGETLKQKASATLDENAPLCASKAACTWCPAANMPGRQGGCPAHAKWQLDQIELDFEDLDEAAASGTPWAPPPVEGLTPERLVQISLAKSGLEKFLEYAHAKALQHIMDYGPTGGQKVVLGRRPPQKWRNADAAEAFMCQQLPSANPFNKKMKTPTQAAAEIGKKYEIPAALVERGQPKAVVELTGTPSPNGLVNLWGLSYIADQGERLGRTKTAFLNRWFDTSRYTYEVKAKPHAEAEILDKMKDIMFSLDPKDYAELPPLVENVIKVQLPPRVMDEYRRFKRTLISEAYDVEAVNAAVLTRVRTYKSA